MDHGHKSCVLCCHAKETKLTGALSTKDNVTAHQNCLLFASGIICRDSPLSDDLFGFSVDDVMDEVRRGKQLVCNRCRRKGATAGCEVGRCKKSYHYPCAIEEGAMPIEEAEKGKYVLFCDRHYQQKLEKSCANGRASLTADHQSSSNDSEAGPSKVYCLTCEKTEGNISLEHLSSSIDIYYCDKHAPASKRNANGESTARAARSSGHSRDSKSVKGPKSSKVKRHLTFNGKQKDPPSKRKHVEQLNEVVTDDSSDPDVNEPDADMAVFAPLESDIDASIESQTVHQPTRNTQRPTGSCPGEPVVDESKDGANSDSASDADSESLLAPVRRSNESPLLSAASSSAHNWSQTTVHTVFSIEADEVIDDKEFSKSLSEHKISVPQQTSASPAPSPESSQACIITIRDPSPAPPTPHPNPGMNSEMFWRSCNAAGCTQAIFTAFINHMSNISGRILSGQASQEDYDVALKVMGSSGKLTELVTMQQKELKKKQMELEKAAAAMNEAISALRK